MAIECFVFRPGQGAPKIYKFVSLPRVGEHLDLPDFNEDFVVERIGHMAREPDNNEKPTVQMHLRIHPVKRRKG